MKEFNQLSYRLLASIIICLLVRVPAPAKEASLERYTHSPESTSTRLKVGLALGGGGTRGAAHVTVLKVLEQEGIPIDLIAGTSIGSIVGGMYSAGLTPAQIQEKFMDKSIMNTFMTVPLWFRLLIGPFLLIPRAMGFNSYDGLYKGGKFRKFLNNSVPADKRLIESLNIPFAAVAIDLIDGKAHSIRSGNFGLAIQASSAVPALRKPVAIGDHLFIDGFLGGNLPVRQAREMGADIVIAVNVDERIDKVPLAAFRKMGSVSKRTINLKLAAIDAPLARDADVVIHPDVDGIDLISNKVSDAKKAFKNGAIAAREAIPEIKRILKAKGITTVSSR